VYPVESLIAHFQFGLSAATAWYFDTIIKLKSLEFDLFDSHTTLLLLNCIRRRIQTNPIDVSVYFKPRLFVKRNDLGCQLQRSL
jgi:hypothetical protein